MQTGEPRFREVLGLVMEEQGFEACLIPKHPTACLFLRPEATLRTSRPQMPKKRLNNSGWLLSPREPNVTATSLPLVLSPPHFTHVDSGPQGRGGLCWQPRERSGGPTAPGFPVGLRLHLLSIPGTHPCATLPDGLTAHPAGSLPEASLLT